MKLTLLATVFKHLAFVFLSSILIPMAAMAYSEHSGTINSETWGAGTHNVTTSVTVSDGQVLTIMPGAVIKFAPGTLMTILGTLRAVGAEANFIVFTSRDDDTYGEKIKDSDGSPSRGDWAGIYLNGYGTYDGIGELDYCRIRYGGGAGGTSANVYFYYPNSGHFANSISEESAIDGIKLANCSPQITDSTVARNGNHGLYAVGSGAATVTGNIFTDNNQYAVYLNQTAIPPNISGNTGSGNGTNGLVLAGRVTSDQSWSSVPGFPIVLLSKVTVNNDISLTVASGTVIKFGEGIQLLVQGILDANGSAGNWVVFTSLKDDDYDGDTNGDGDSSSAMPGDWAGIYLNGFGTYDGIGEFDYCRIRYGGNAGGTSANVYFSDSNSGHFANSISEESAIDGIRLANCSPQITDSTVARNGNHGLYAEGSGAATVTGNIFTDNNQYAVYLNQIAIPPNISGNTGSGNDTDGLVLAGTVTVDQSWSSVPGFPLVLHSEVTVNDNIMLTIAAGTSIKFGAGAQLTVRGTLDVNGRAGNWVVFTSLKDDDYDGDTNGDGDSSSAMPGDWAGIYLNGFGTYDGIGEFDYCRIRYGGNAGGTSANVYFSDSNSGHFANSINEESAIDGIRIANCSPQILNSTFSNNAGRGLTVSSGSPTVSNSILWGDGGDEISGSPTVTFSDVKGGYAGVGNINKDPLFLDPGIGDYRLDVCSPAIDAGDPVENLTADYIFGEYILSVDRVTAVMPGDPIWITDGESYEIDEVVGTTATTVTVLNGFFNSYTVANRTYLFTAISDFTGEPEPHGRRINMGSYGGGSEAVSSLVCRADLEGDDLDVDGSDLVVFREALDTSLGDPAYNPDADFNNDGSVNEIDIAIFAEEYGRTDCPDCL